jgi:hypothetical protein
MELNLETNQQDLDCIFTHLDKLNDDLKKIAHEILKIETEKNLLTKPSMFIFSIINRAIGLNKGFKCLAELNNYVAAINFLRLQADNCMRLFAMTLVKDRGVFFDSVESGEHIRNLKDSKNRKMTDKLLSEELDILFPGFRSLYENTSGLIHFSKEHFNQNHQTTVTENNLSGIVLFNGEHFFSIPEKVDYSYNMLWVSTRLYDLIIGYKLHINEFLKDY